MLVRREMSDVYYRCTAKFNLTDKPSQTTADNNINWTSSCHTSTINVACTYIPTVLFYVNVLGLTHSLTSRPSSMMVGDSRRPLRYLFFSIVLDLVTSPLAECIRNQSTLQCRVSVARCLCVRHTPVFCRHR